MNAPLYFNPTVAHNEGWTINVTDAGVTSIKTTNTDNLLNDAEALAYVLSRASRSSYHIAALGHVLRNDHVLCRPSFVLSGNYGTVTVDIANGAILAVEYPDQSYKTINRVNVAEAKAYFGGLITPEGLYDITLFGYWDNEEYVDPNPSRLAYLAARRGDPNSFATVIRGHQPKIDQFVTYIRVIVPGTDSDEARDNLEATLAGTNVINWAYGTADMRRLNEVAPRSGTPEDYRFSVANAFDNATAERQSLSDNCSYECDFVLGDGTVRGIISEGADAATGLNEARAFLADTISQGGGEVAYRVRRANRFGRTLDTSEIRAPTSPNWSDGVVR